MLPVIQRVTALATLLLALVTLAAAVEPLYRVAANVIYLPRDGVALSARTGAVLWRFPRLVSNAHTYTDGNGLLLISWVDRVDIALHLRFTRICRLRTRDGKTRWCRDWSSLAQWAVDTGGRRLYLHASGRLQVIDTADGQPDQGFKLDHDHGLTLLPLPAGGALLLAQDAAHARALVYRPGAAALTAETLPARVYPFRGNGRGLIFYARNQGEFYLPDNRLLLRDPGRGPSRFPKGSLDQHGFLFADWQGSQPVLRGGTYAGDLWQAPRPAADPQLALAANSAVMLDPGPTATRLTVWDLASGAIRFTRTFPGSYPALACADGVLLLQSDTDLRLLDPRSGAQRWRLLRHEGALAAISASALLFWEADGNLLALARSDGSVLWRVHFASPPLKSLF